MSKEMKNRQKPPTVVGRLMGIDSFPMPQSTETAMQSTRELYSHIAWTNKHCQWLKDEPFDDALPQRKDDFKDVYEVPKKPLVPNAFRDQSIVNEIGNDSLCRKRMSLVQQKFSEARRIAADENSLRSKEFQDAIKFLSSNRELFLQFLEEPNSQFSKHLIESRSSSLPRHITVLKPFNATTKRDNEDSGSKRSEVNNRIVGKTNKHYVNSDISQRLSQPTKIVVLKPTPRKPYEVRTKEVAKTSLSDVLRHPRFFGAMEDDEGIRSKKLAKGIACHMRDEALFSSVMANGYVGDESSCNRSESEFMEEDSGSLSDSELATLSSTHSCDYTNGLSSPLSSISFRKASRSPESSVIREAKKRLSERLAVVATNVCNQEHLLERSTSSGTLAELLDNSELKKRVGLEVSSRNEESTLGRSNDLSRSNSAPVLFTDYRATDVETSSSSRGRVVKKENVKSGFKAKVTSFFFSKSKKNNDVSRQQHRSAETTCDDDLSRVASNVQTENYELVNNDSNGFATSVCDDRTGRVCLQAESDGPYSRNFDQTVSDLPSHSFERVLIYNRQSLARSQPIESVARSLSSECSYFDEKPSKRIDISRIFSKADKEHEQFLFVKGLISSGQLDTNSGSFFTKWSSLDSPLNPILLDQYSNAKDSEFECALSHSQKRLLFDCVNAALLDMSYGIARDAYPWSRVNCGMLGSVGDEVWRKISSWEYCEKIKNNGGGNINMFVDGLVRKEGSEWKSGEFVWREMYELSEEIGGKVLDELVEEMLSHLILG